jgi:hypothetical protein
VGQDVGVDLIGLDGGGGAPRRSGVPNGAERRYKANNPVLVD